MAHLNAISFPSIEELREYAIRPATKFACTFRRGIKGSRVETPRVPEEKTTVCRIGYTSFCRYTDHVSLSLHSHSHLAKDPRIRVS